jgi:GT2 family glycosyltransferase
MSPTLSAIVLSFEAPDLATAAVESLLASEGLAAGALEIVVVDNGSRAPVISVLRAAFGDRIVLVGLDRNLGWGGGNNRGIERARGEYVFLLNQDATVERRALAELLSCAARASDRTPDGAVMVAPKVLLQDRPEVIDTTGHLLSLDGLNRGRGRLEADRGQYDDTDEALFPSGAAALYSRALFAPNGVGPFDESLFLYGDDAEFGTRARRRGVPCAFAPRARVFHKYSASAGAYSGLKAFHVERNRLILLLKLFPFATVLRSPAHTAARLVLQAGGVLLGRGAAAEFARRSGVGSLVAVTVRAWFSFARAIPATLRARRVERARQRLSDAEFLRLVSRFRLTAREAALKA